MFTFLHFALVAAVFILILYLWAKKSNAEHFDTYYQHDAGAAKVLDKDLSRDFRSYIRYNWADKDKYGYNMYDKYYDEEVFERNREPLIPLDLKFTTREAYDMPMEAARDMKVPQTAIIRQGNLITLQQKNTW